MPAREPIARYKEKGCDAVCITDHLYSGWREELPPCAARGLLPERVSSRPRRGPPLCLSVLLGAETRFGGERGNEDMLAYGVREDDIARLMTALDARPALPDYHNALRARGFLLIQAHPFRPGLRAGASLPLTQEGKK